MNPLLITGIGAAAGGILGGLFGKKKKEWKLQDLINYGMIPYNKDEELAKWSSEIMGKVKEQRANMTQKAEQEGISTPESIYSAESGIWDAFSKGQQQIDAKDKEEKNRIAQMLFSLNAQEEANTPTTLQNVVGGIFSGGSLGSQVANYMEDLKPDKLAETPKDVNNTKPTTDNNAGKVDLVNSLKSSDEGLKKLLKEYLAYKNMFGGGIKGFSPMGSELAIN